MKWNHASKKIVRGWSGEVNRDGRLVCTGTGTEPTIGRANEQKCVTLRYSYKVYLYLYV
jgi:hypothetical protein